MVGWVWMIGAIINVNTDKNEERFVFAAEGIYPVYGRDCSDQTVSTSNSKKLAVPYFS